MKDRTARQMISVYEIIKEKLDRINIQPTIHILDNEISKDFEDTILTHTKQVQLVPPYIYRSNVAERAIQTFKHHFIAGLTSASASFPLSLWCRLVNQATMTLNMLRTSNIDPTKSAYEAVYGRFDYNTTPLAPPGSKATVHRKLNQRTS